MKSAVNQGEGKGSSPLQGHVQEHWGSVVGEEVGPTSQDLSGQAKDLGFHPKSNRNLP